MSPAEVGSLLALVAMLVAALAQAPPLGEILVATGAVGLVLGLHAVSPSAAGDQVRQLVPVVAFLSAALVLADAADGLGVFGALWDLVAALAAGRPVAMLRLTFGLAAAVTAVLSLDATVVLLTPVIGLAARRQALGPAPHVIACARLANSGSLLLPVSNLTNLLAFSAAGLSFVGFTIAMAPVWLTAVGLEYFTVRLAFAARLRDPGRPAALRPALPGIPMAVLAAVFLGFLATSPLHVAPVWIAAIGAVALLAFGRDTRLHEPVRVLRAAQLPFAYFVVCWAVVVAAVDTALGGLAGRLLPESDSFESLVVIALVATVAANALNNLAATLLLTPLLAPLGLSALVAMLIGVNVGANATYAGSLANLLWRRTVHDMDRVGRDWSLMGLTTTVPIVVGCTVVAALWVPFVAAS